MVLKITFFNFLTYRDRFRDICQKPPENAWVGENNPIAKRKNAIFSKSPSKILPPTFHPQDKTSSRSLTLNNQMHVFVNVRTVKYALLRQFGLCCEYALSTGITLR